MIQLNNFEGFKDALIRSESAGNYQAVYRDSNGKAVALGLYQFTPERIKDVANALGVPVPTENQFLLDRNMQDLFFKTHIELILNYINEKGLLSYIGDRITGQNKYHKTVPINIYGLVGGAHLGGEYGLYRFLKYGDDRSDALGTWISDYVAKFSDIVPETEKKTLV